MVRLHLVGFTTDLKNLIFANERGATTGGFVVRIDARLRQTLEEVARLAEESQPVSPESEETEPAAAPARRSRDSEEVRSSKLTPKEIQSLVRQGKTEEQVARMAQTDVAWIRRFTFPILAERAGVIEAVKAATLSKPRLGPSGMNIGRAVEENLGSRRSRIGAEEIDASWKAVRKNGRWHVSFEYDSRGRKRLARFSFDPDTRHVEALNDIAVELGWRAGVKPRTASTKAVESTARSRASVRTVGAAKAAGGPPSRVGGSGAASAAGAAAAESRVSTSKARPDSKAPSSRGTAASKGPRTRSASAAKASSAPAQPRGPRLATSGGRSVAKPPSGRPAAQPSSTAQASPGVSRLPRIRRPGR